MVDRWVLFIVYGVIDPVHTDSRPVVLSVLLHTFSTQEFFPFPHGKKEEERPIYVCTADRDVADMDGVPL